MAGQPNHAPAPVIVNVHNMASASSSASAAAAASARSGRRPQQVSCLGAIVACVLILSCCFGGPMWLLSLGGTAAKSVDPPNQARPTVTTTPRPAPAVTPAESEPAPIVVPENTAAAAKSESEREAYFLPLTQREKVQAPARSANREWRRDDGTLLATGAIKSVAFDTVTIRTDLGVDIASKLADLSDADRAYVEAWKRQPRK